MTPAKKKTLPLTKKAETNLEDLHKELKDGVQLNKPPEKDMRIRQIDHDNRMMEFKELKKKFENMQDLMKEIPTGVSLQKIPEKEKKTLEIYKKSRMYEIEQLKKNIDSALDIVNNLKGEFEKGDVIKSLEKVSPEVLKANKEDQQKRIKTLQETNKFLIAFGESLENITKVQLKPRDPDAMALYEKEKASRLETIAKLQSTFDLTKELPEDQILPKSDIKKSITPKKTKASKKSKVSTKSETKKKSDV